MIEHVHEGSNAKNGERYKLLRWTVARMLIDGLSNLKFTIVARDSSSVFDKITVDIGDKT